MGRRGRSSGEGATQNPPKRVRTHRYNLRSVSSREKRDKQLGGEQDGRRTNISDEDFRDKNAALKVESLGSALKFGELNLFLEENRKAHHTDEYEQDDLIVRRGQKFTLACTFDRDISESQDIIVLKFAYGARPQESKGTIIRVPVMPADPDLDLGWDSKVLEVKEKTVKLEVMSEPDCNIGKYSILIETKLKDSKKDFTKDDTEKSLIMLFNAWCKAKKAEDVRKPSSWLAEGLWFYPVVDLYLERCIKGICGLPPPDKSNGESSLKRSLIVGSLLPNKEDVVYMADEKQRHEYVMNDRGRIWVGSVYRNHGRPWYFGQFEEPILEVSLGLLDKGELADSARNSAVSVIRCLSALANSSDEDGLLTGRWTSDYPKGCTKPWEWTGSAEICKQFYETGDPVEFGQCWVFSGICTTLLRTLGIPTRSVTNFASAHDCDCSMTIDRHFDEEGESLDDMNDSTWNFHVWNESFFRRIDLPEGYNGWQAHDATPQEYSEGVMRCGPAPLEAIKKGHVYLNFDVAFIFSEVNGDKVEWEVMEDGSMKVSNIDKYSVGKCISTKAVGSNDRHDLTLDYKYAEGSPEERKVVEFVNRFSTRRHCNIYKKELKKEVEFKVIEPENCVVGEDMVVGVKVTNIADVERTLKVRLTVSSSFYTGVVGKKVKGEVSEVKVGAGEEKEVLMTCTPDEYEEVMNAECLFNLTATCRVTETNRLFARVEPFNLLRGGLTIEVDDKIPSFTDRKAKITFKNHTNLKLHNAVFHAEGSFLVKQKVFNIRKVIHPGDEMSVDVPLFARRLGDREILATFSSDELTNIEAEAELFVVSKGDWKEEMEAESADAE